MKNIRPLNPLSRIKYRYLEWSWDRVLKQSGCVNWESYFKKNDPDFDAHATSVKQQFVGYPYVLKIPESSIDLVVDPYFGVVRSAKTLNQWCLDNCSKKYRFEWYSIVGENDDSDEIDSTIYYRNPTFADDVRCINDSTLIRWASSGSAFASGSVFASESQLFFGFKDERDFLIFTLKWS